MTVTGEANIRGIDVDKLAKGFAEEANQFKSVCLVVPTSAREIRWYQKTAGFLAGVTTTGMTSENIANTAHGAIPTVVDAAWTRNTSYVRKYFVESPVLTEEDIADNDVDIYITLIRDLTRAVERQVDARIYAVVTASAQSTASTAAWDAGSGQDPIKDLLTGKRKIRQKSYNPEGAYLLLNSTDHANLLTWLITTKGASIPSFASARTEDGVVMEIVGLKVKVSENVTSDECMIIVPQQACTWKTFVPITSGIVTDIGIGKKIRIWEEGEAILTDPNAAHKTTNTLA